MDFMDPVAAPHNSAHSIIIFCHLPCPFQRVDNNSVALAVTVAFY